MMSGVVVTRRARPGELRRLELMPAGDGPAELFDESPGLGWHLAAQAGDGRERERVDVRVLPAAQQARHDAQLRLGQSPVGSQFPLEPLHADSRTRKQEHPVKVEKDQLVPPGHVQEPVQVHAGDRCEPLRLRGPSTALTGRPTMSSPTQPVWPWPRSSPRPFKALPCQGVGPALSGGATGPLSCSLADLGRPPARQDGSVLSADEKPGVQVRLRIHPPLPPGPERAMRAESEYARGGILAYLAAYDVHRPA